MMNNRVLASAAILAAGFGLLQFVPVTTANPPLVKERTINASLEIPPHVKSLMDKACASCHSNQTEWPWYAKIAPVSWLTSRDVNRGRKALNFSEWNDRSARSPGIAIGALAAACEDVKTARMPLAPYRLMHPESRLSKTEVATFCQWTTTAMHEIIATRRTASARKAATD